ncbi:translocation and assembly module lipoprotein TamL [Daejeonella oryzae]|uniref:translocation and assembly module lipoprotein TamL n=1 Tax=Daejeonella oryzae TaxID=1122943 RepID=UPI0004154C23|nr:BamA/TamA family outer membrane protein [Daejeonella oryzae]
MLNLIKYFWLFAILIIASCSNIKYLPKGEKLYIGGDVKIEGDSIKKKETKALRTELKGLLRPKPNTSILGLRPKLFAFNIAGTPKKPKGLRNWLKNKIGEPPVFASYVDLQNNQNILQNRLQNKGYFQAVVTGDTISKNSKVKAEYIAELGPRYLISSVNFPSDSSILEKAISATASKTLLKVNDPYNLDVIKGERDRIDQNLKENGFYYFGPDYLFVRVDSTIGQHKVNLYVTVKPSTPSLARKVYTIDDIYIYPNFTLAQSQADTSKSSAVLFDGYYVIDKDSTFKPSVFSRSMFFKSGEVYNRKDHNLSLSRLTTLGSFKFVKNRFERNDSQSNPSLDAFYYLTPLPKKSLRAEVLGTTKSNNLTGSELSLSWRNRNAFRGAEQLSIRGYGSFEVQVSGTQRGYNTFRAGTEATLSVPRFLIPFFDVNTSNAFVPRSKFTLGYEILNKRKLYSLNSFRASAGYNWKENIRKEHEVNLLSFNYVQPANITPLYSDSVRNNITLAKTIEKQFIVGSTYSFTYNDQLEVTRKNNIFFNGNVDLAGNILGLLQKADYTTGDTATLFGARYSQYAKIDGDLRYYFKTGTNSKIASRLIAGLGYPYGNSSELPFIKQFFIGGSNSIRAFRARSVGPGTYRPDDSSIDNFLPDQSGDLKLEFNTEYRQKLAGIVHGALLLDAGNIWLFNENPNKPGAKFSKEFLSELAVGTGFGLRFDLSFLVLRTDLAFPLRKPWLPKGDRWVVDQIKFADKQWRRDNLVFNLAIGYPF